MNKTNLKKYYKEASLTVEAAIVLPIFVFACYSFLFFFYVIEIQENLHYASTKACDSVASFGYLVRYIKENDVVDENETAEGQKEEETESKLVEDLEDEVKTLLYNYADATLIKSYVKKKLAISNSIDRFIIGGYGGISFYGSNLFDDEEYVTIVMSYEIKCPVFGGILPSFPVVQCVRMRSFNGYAVEKRGGEVSSQFVYVTEHGTVYHTHNDCTYIKIDLESVMYDNVSFKRNSSGAKYYACESCTVGHKAELGHTILNVYITSSGTRYHISTSCNKIKRSVTKIMMYEVGDKKLCSKCAKRDGGEK